MTRQEEKKMLRSIMRRLEDKLSQRYMETADQAIMSHLAAMPEYQEAQTVFCFVSVRREIDTFPILKDAFHHFHHIRNDFRFPNTILIHKVY